MKSEISVSLTLTGLDLQPDKITTKLGINPTKIWFKGDLINLKGKIRYSDNGWSLKSQLDESMELEAHIKSIFEQLQPVWKDLKEICFFYQTEISCVVYVSEQVPIIYFNSEILNQIHQLNAALDVDLYILPEPTQKHQKILNNENKVFLV
ncbi:hypothetical protein C7H19_01805 [Aphanothece hegewaldii CCALA 016]|uniref:DUF4279 domain-containing protein n=1 Tax=Aphanothece hegewaldii CCALA 016 TaxID=2107694 RepID=A0A2T1M3Y6_9CHRO|nr:DUF4279 domain-containing protein [Aphanothece hegewaldii]PSF39549.1 hypothetical protein C7H19_01805 [Aphanothece hegewaldii CCALA 016]